MIHNEANVGVGADGLDAEEHEAFRLLAPRSLTPMSVDTTSIRTCVGTTDRLGIQSTSEQPACVQAFPVSASSPTVGVEHCKYEVQRLSSCQAIARVAPGSLA